MSRNGNQFKSFTDLNLALRGYAGPNARCAMARLFAWTKNAIRNSATGYFVALSRASMYLIYSPVMARTCAISHSPTVNRLRGVVWHQAERTLLTVTFL